MCHLLSMLMDKGTPVLGHTPNAKQSHQRHPLHNSSLQTKASTYENKPERLPETHYYIFLVRSEVSQVEGTAVGSQGKKACRLDALGIYVPFLLARLTGCHGVALPVQCAFVGRGEAGAQHSITRTTGECALHRECLRFFGVCENRTPFKSSS